MKNLVYSIVILYDNYFTRGWKRENEEETCIKLENRKSRRHQSNRGLSRASGDFFDK